MAQETVGLEPWEIPPDESYWQALLKEGECGAGHGPAFPFEEMLPHDEPATDNASIADRASTTDSASMTDGASINDDAPSAQEPQVAGQEACWEAFLACQAEDRTVDLQVVGYNRGGVLVEWGDVVGFVPASQLCDGVASGDDQARKAAFVALIGRTLTLKVIEVDQEQNRLILSERATRRVMEPDLRVLEGLCDGDVCQGRVTNLCSFGAFVDLGGAEGLIHISELSWGRVAHPSDVLQSGQEVEVFVLSVDRDRGRIALSLKRLHPDPWETAEARYAIGQVVTGVVTNVVNFGAFVRLEEGLEGLIHNSEWLDLLDHRTLHAGETVHVRVMNIDRDRHRMGLTLE
jgi:small subunit ribosomal protein S1